MKTRVRAPRLSALGVRSAVVLVSLMAISCDDAMHLVEVPTEREAIEILVRLDEQGVPRARKVEIPGRRGSTWSLLVPATSMKAARRTLAAHGLPREPRAGVEDATKSGGVIPNDEETRAKLCFAKSNELATTVEQMHPRILWARVHLVLPDPELTTRSRDAAPPEAKASVTLRYRTDDPKQAGRSASFSLPDPSPARNQDHETDTGTAGRTGSDSPSAGEPPAETADWPVSGHEICSLIAQSVEGLPSHEVSVLCTAVYIDAESEEPINDVADVTSEMLLSKNVFLGMIAALALLGSATIFLGWRLMFPAGGRA